MKTRRFTDTIKHVGTQRFEVAILRDVDDLYAIAYSTAYDARIHYSENIREYSLASQLFQMKLTELEGQ